jgi:hypothetical protein
VIILLRITDHVFTLFVRRNIILLLLGWNALISDKGLASGIDAGQIRPRRGRK